MIARLRTKLNATNHSNRAMKKNRTLVRTPIVVAPPLQTLLGPGLTNSATSSVASSLEVPHAIRRSRYSNARLAKKMMSAIIF
jgi:hypothetical protein